MDDTTAFNRASKLGKGFNLNNWLEAFWEPNYPKSDVYSFKDLEIMKSFGMSTVRLPVLFEWLAEEEYPYKLKLGSPVYDIIDMLAQWCRDLNINLILCNHHGPKLNNYNYKNKTHRLCGIWKNLAEKYKSLPTDAVMYEIKNEPDSSINNDNLYEVQSRVIDEIRKTDADRTLIVGANYWNAAWALADSQPYQDDNIIYTFHSYSPYEFTHQGLSWANLETGVIFPINRRDIDLIRNDFNRVKEWAIRHSVPLFLGEYGVGTGADELSRCNWIEIFSEIIKEIDIPWAYWDVKHIKDSFGIFLEEEINPDKIIPAFQNAMGLTKF